MKPVEERAKECREEILPILRKHQVNIVSEPFIDVTSGQVKSRVVWRDEPVKKAEEELPAQEKKDA